MISFWKKKTSRAQPRIDLGKIHSLSLKSRRKVPRADVQEYDSHVELDVADQEARTFRVKTIAEFGASFLPDRSDFSDAFGQPRETYLRFNDVRIPVTSRFIYHCEDVIGVEFVDPSPAARSLIRTHFFLEFIAASLKPSVRVVENTLSTSHLIVFGEEGAYGMEIALDHSHIKSVTARLGHLGMEIRWKDSGPMRAILTEGISISDPFIRNQLTSFLRNLNGIGPALCSAIEEIFETARIELEYLG